MPITRHGAFPELKTSFMRGIHIDALNTLGWPHLMSALYSIKIKYSGSVHFGIYAFCKPSSNTNSRFVMYYSVKPCATTGLLKILRLEDG